MNETENTEVETASDSYEDESELLAYVKKLWLQAKSHHTNMILPRLLACLQAKRGVYPPDLASKLAEHGLDKTFLRIVANRQRIAVAWIRDIYNKPGERHWSLQLTSVPSLHPEVMTQIHNTMLAQQAMVADMVDPATGQQVVSITPEEEEALQKELMEKAIDFMEEELEAMEKSMQDELEEGGWTKALNQFIDDLCTFPVAYIKGPVIRKTQGLEWTKNGDGTYSATATEKFSREYERVSPFDMYPGPQNETCHDGFIFQRHRFTHKEVADLLGMEKYGFRNSTIQEVLDYCASGSGDIWCSDTDRDLLEGKSVTLSLEDSIPALEFYGPIRGDMLNDWNISSSEGFDAYKYYNVVVWIIADKVCKVAINDDPFGRTPFDKTSFEEVPGSFVGNTIYDMISDIERINNKAVRALDLNLGFTSGPITVMDSSSISGSENVKNLQPFQIFKTSANSSFNPNARFLEFYQAQSRIPELLQVIQNMNNLADEVSNIPRYMGGAASGGGPATTATGFSMIMKSASTTLRDAVNNIDKDVIEPRLKAMYYYKMMYDNDSPARRSDLNIVANGSSSMANKEALQARINEFMNNPNMGLLGPDIVRAMLLAQANNLGIDIDKYLRMAKVTMKDVQEEMPPAQPQQPAADGRQLGDGTPVNHGVA